MEFLNCTVLIPATLAIGITAALAQGDPITERKDIMKANGAAARAGTQMIRGEAPFDLAKAKEVFDGVRFGMTRFPELFPEPGRPGETRAAPKIWEDPQGFRAASVKIVEDATQAAATTTDLDSFRAGFQKVAANCNSCHETYRLSAR
jgi:cytochrome c556